MGWLSKGLDSLTGGSGKAAKKAARDQAYYTKLAQQENERQFNVTKKNLTPFYEAGIQHLGDVQQGATAHGFGNDLAGLLGGALSPITDARFNALQQTGASAGLNFNPQQAQSMANLNPEEALAMEQMLYGRKAGMVGQAQNMGQQLGGYGMQHGSDIASLLQQAGEARASGALGYAQGVNQGINSLTSLASGAVGAFGK